MRIFSPVRASIVAAALLAGGALPPLPAAAQNSGSQGYPSRLETFRDDAGGFFGRIFGNDEAPQAQPPGEGRSGQVAQMSASDLMMRLDRIEGQMRQLTGQIEELQHRNHQLEQQLRRNQEDVEYRLNERAGGPPRAARPRPQPQAHPPAAPPPAAAPPAASGRRSDVFDPRDNPGAPGAPQTLGALPRGRPSAPLASSAGDDASAASVPEGRAAGDPLDLSTLSDRAANDPALDPAASAPRNDAAAAAAPRMIPGPLPAPPPRNSNATGGGQVLASAPSATPRDAFALAYGYVQRKDYGLADEALRAFLQKYPQDRLAADAHYWLGETLFQRQRYRDAAESFLTVSTKYDQSGRAPEALLRLGQSLAALGEREAACATLGEVLRKFPRASGLKASVEREQKRVRC